jgi:hypothetical protein
MEFLGDLFFIVHDIDIHQLNLGQFRNIEIFNEISFKKCVFLHLFSNECIIISYFKGKTTTISKRMRFYRWALHYFFQFSFV